MSREYVVPTDARAEYKKLIQRANRRILANLKYIKDEGIRDNAIKTSLAHDYGNKRKWAGKSTPLSSSVRFASEQDYKRYIQFIMRWGEDTGTRGGHRADPKRLESKGKESIYKALYGMINNKGISLEKWYGDLPPDIKKDIEGLSLEQISRFFEHTDTTGEEDYFDSDQVDEDNGVDAFEYIRGRLAEVKQYYPRPPKKKKRKKTKRKTKGRKKY